MINRLGIQSTVGLLMHHCVAFASTAMVNFIQQSPKLQILFSLCTLHHQVSLQYGSACLFTIRVSDWGMGIMTRNLL